MKRLSIEVDLRLFRLLGYDDTNVGRFGVGVRYRFDACRDYAEIRSRCARSHPASVAARS